jgi:hypothetical protein
LKIKNAGEVCQNCGKKEPGVGMNVIRYYGEEGQRPETWCLECVQGKNPIREQFEWVKFKIFGKSD